MPTIAYSRQHYFTRNAGRRIKNSFRHFFLFLLFTFYFSLSASAQFLDSISYSLHKRPGLTGGISATNTFIDGLRSPIYTAHAGLDFDHRIILGAGVSWLQLPSYSDSRSNSPFYFDKTVTDTSGTYVVHPSLKFVYANVYAEYIYFRSKKWLFSIPVQIGMGDSRYQYNFNGENIQMDKHVVLLYLAEVSGEYKITKWFGAGMDVGYRLMLINNKKIGTKFNSPVFDIGVVIFWGQLYKAVFPESKLARKIQG